MSYDLLTSRQLFVLEVIELLTRKRGFPSTLREIGAATGIGSTNGVNDHLVALERKGYIRRDRLLSRSIVVIDHPPREAVR